jgi:hypothetical protein
LPPAPGGEGRHMSVESKMVGFFDLEITNMKGQVMVMAIALVALKRSGVIFVYEGPS